MARLSHAAGVISSLLNIKVILEVADSELKVLRKGRGMKTITKFIDEMDDDLRKLKNVKAIGISHADGLELSEKIKAQLQAAFPAIEILVRTTDPVIATHAAPVLLQWCIILKTKKFMTRLVDIYLSRLNYYLKRYEDARYEKNTTIVDRPRDICRGITRRLYRLAVIDTTSNEST